MSSGVWKLSPHPSAAPLHVVTVHGASCVGWDTLAFLHSLFMALTVLRAQRKKSPIRIFLFWRCLSILAAVTKCLVVYEDRDVFLTGLLLEMSRVLADSVSGEDQPYDHRWHSQSSHDTEGVWAPLGLSCKDSLRVLIWWTNTLQRPPFDIIPGDWMSVDEFGARGTHKASNNSRGLLDV